MLQQESHSVEETLPPSRWRRSWPLLSLVLLQWSLGGYVIATDPMVGEDAVYYITLAKYAKDYPGQIFQIRTLNSGYSYLVSGVRFLLPEGDGESEERRMWEFSGRVVSLLGGTVGVICLWFLLPRIIADRFMCWWGIFLLILGRKFATYFGLPLTDMPAWALSLLGLLLGMKAYDAIRAGRVGAVPYAALTALVASAGFYIRYEAAGVGLVSGLLWMTLLPRHVRHWKLIVVCGLVSLVVAVAATSPHFLFRTQGPPKHTLEAFTPKASEQSNTSRTSAPQEQPQHGSAETNCLARAGKRLMMASISALHPVTVVFIALWILLRIGNHFLHWPDVRLGRMQPDGCMLLLLCTLVYLPPVLLRYLALGVMDWRYVMLLASLYCVLGGAGLVGASRVLRRGRRTWPHVGYALLIGLILLATLAHSLRPIRDHLLVLKEAAAYLRAHLKPDDFVVCNGRVVPYYAGTYEPRIILGNCPSISRYPREMAFFYRVFHVSTTRSPHHVRNRIRLYAETLRPGSVWVVIQVEQGTGQETAIIHTLASMGFVERRVFRARPPETPAGKFYRQHITATFESGLFVTPLVVYIYQGPGLAATSPDSQPVPNVRRITETIPSLQRPDGRFGPACED